MREAAFIIINPLGQIGKPRKREIKWFIPTAVKQNYVLVLWGGGDRDTAREVLGVFNAFPGLHFKLTPRQPKHLRGAWKQYFASDRT